MDRDFDGFVLGEKSQFSGGVTYFQEAEAFRYAVVTWALVFFFDDAPVVVAGSGSGLGVDLTVWTRELLIVLLGNVISKRYSLDFFYFAIYEFAWKLTEILHFKNSGVVKLRKQ